MYEPPTPCPSTIHPPTSLVYSRIDLAPTDDLEAAEVAEVAEELVSRLHHEVSGDLLHRAEPIHLPHVHREDIPLRVPETNRHTVIRNPPTVMRARSPPPNTDPCYGSLKQTVTP